MRYTLLLLAFLSIPTARACSCAMPTLERAWHTSFAIFVGTAQESERTDVHGVGDFPMSFDYFEVERVFKGEISEPHDRISLLDGVTGCEMHFDEGERYLVYADEHFGLLLGASMCTRSLPLSRADDEIAALEALAAAQPATDPTTRPQYIEIAELDALHDLVRRSVSRTYRDLLYLSGILNLALVLGLFWLGRRGHTAGATRS